jgi:hypothetical protein
MIPALIRLMRLLLAVRDTRVGAVQRFRDYALACDAGNEPECRRLEKLRNEATRAKDEALEALLKAIDGEP